MSVRRTWTPDKVNDRVVAIDVTRPGRARCVTCGLTCLTWLDRAGNEHAANHGLCPGFLVASARPAAEPLGSHQAPSDATVKPRADSFEEPPE